MTYDEARLAMAGWLERHAEQPYSPEEGFEEIDAALPREAGPEWAKLHVALTFWDCWIDASNHDWKYHEPLTAQDWAPLAQELARNLRRNEDISNPLILRIR